MRYRIRYKASDSLKERTYLDQDRYELYDLYDLVDSDEKVPEKVASAPIIQENDRRVMVKIDYPVESGLFTLEGKTGVHINYVEAGRKAFVRGGRYVHPVKGWHSRIVFMSPLEYIEACHRMFQSRGLDKTLEDLIDYKSSEYDIDSVFESKVGDLNYCVIDYRDMQQEGLHRAIFAMNRNVKSIPVTIIQKG